MPFDLLPTTEGSPLLFLLSFIPSLTFFPSFPSLSLEYRRGELPVRARSFLRIVFHRRPLSSSLLSSFSATSHPGPSNAPPHAAMSQRPEKPLLIFSFVAGKLLVPRSRSPLFPASKAMLLSDFGPSGICRLPMGACIETRRCPTSFPPPILFPLPFVVFFFPFLFLPLATPPLFFSLPYLLLFA